MHVKTTLPRMYYYYSACINMESSLQPLNLLYNKQRHPLEVSLHAALKI